MTMAVGQIVIAIALIFVSTVYGAGGDNAVVHQWNLLDFGFPSAADRQQAIAQGNLEAENCIPIDVQPYADGRGCRIFTTIPRFQTGVPYSLATVQDRNNQPQLQPYPNYEWHSSHGTNCDGITSAFRVAITECGQMWVIDSGVIGMTQHCPPQLLLFDLSNDQLVHRYRFDSNASPSLYVPIASLFINPIVVVRDPGVCKRAMIYVADVTYHGLVVYDQEKNTAWRVENQFMYPNPEYGTHIIAGENFTLMDGLFGMSADRSDLYFHPLAGVSEYSVPLSVLDNAANWANAVEAMPNEFRKVGIRKSECGAEAMDGVGNLYCVTMNPIELVYWNVRLPHGKHAKRIAINPKFLEFVSGMKVFRTANGREELWMMSNRFQKISAGTLNSNEVNFRIVRIPLDNGATTNEIKFPHDRREGLIFTPKESRARSLA